MRIRPARLALGDLLIAVGALGLITDLFAAQWFEVRPQFRDALLALGEPTTANGWNTFTWIGPLCLLAGAAGLLAVWLQLTRDSPALPVIAVVLAAPLAALTLLALVIRVFLDVPGLQLPSGGGGALQARSGAYLGVAFALVLAVGCWLSLRRDSVAAADSPAFIETVALEPSPRLPQP